jgi:hypothetical protein
MGILWIQVGSITDLANFHNISLNEEENKGVY